MKEILFKAKRISNGKWIEGYLLKCKKDYYICEKAYQCMDGYSSAKGQHYGFGDFVLVDKNTICQYTGRTDNNGKKIWENDICKNIVNYHIFKVTYWENDGCYMFEDQNENGNGYNLYEFEEVEIIGNIFDNPELLVTTEN